MGLELQVPETNQNIIPSVVRIGYALEKNSGVNRRWMNGSGPSVARLLLVQKKRVKNEFLDSP